MARSTLNVQPRARKITWETKEKKMRGLVTIWMDGQVPAHRKTEEEKKARTISRRELRAEFRGNGAVKGPKKQK